MVGEILNGRYEILKSVGFGGMAEVYLAKDVLLDRKIAVKVLRKKFLDNKNQLEQFKREARSAARLIHPSIVTIYDVCDEGDISYILMEYVEGVSLKAFEEQNGRMDPALAVALTAQLASALDHAHKHNIIHCDIKPQNIVLTEAMVPKIVDFGISRIVSNETMAFTASVVGSVHYFSPEQAQGLAVTAQSDIYSLGIVFYEMLTGKVPFDGNNAVSVARKQVEEQAPPLRQYWPEAPDALQGIIDKALAKNLQDRYATAEDMKNDLMRVKNLIYPSKNNETFLDQTIPLQAIATTSPVKAATAAVPEPSKARARSEEEKYQTLIMSLPSFLTREVDDDTSEYGQFEEPESTRKVVPVNAEQKAADTGTQVSAAATLGTAAASAAIAAAGAPEPEQQSLFTEDTGMVTATKKAGPEAGPAIRDENTVSGTGLRQSETVKEPDGKPVVIPVADMSGAYKAESSAPGARPASPGLSVTSDPAVAAAGQKEAQGSLKPEQERKNDTPKKKSGFLKKLIAAVLLLFVLIAGGIFYFFSSSKPEITVPDVNGKPVAEAQQALESQGFKVEIENKVDTSVKPGTVLRMDPVAGIRRKEGATITLVVSGTEKTTAVPKVVGLKQDQAEKLLSEKNLRIEKIEYKWEQDKPEGIILSQAPDEKSQLGENGAVNIVINKKEEKNVAVPDLKGMTLAEARKKLEDLKLKVEVREEDSEKNKDTVIGMSPEVNDTITEGSTVVLLVSNAKKQAGFPATPDKINSNSGKSNGSVTVNRTTGARYAEFVVPGTGTHTVQIVSNNGRSQKVEVSGSYNGGVRLRTKVDSDVQRVGFYVDHRLVEEKSW
ncbi:MAG: serine/threonine protein kinase [Acidaminococcaceae bacterium]|nr:serine/threonine protein kinase [Acidaminococcaceae bacterium]